MNMRATQNNTSLLQKTRIGVVIILLSTISLPVSAGLKDILLEYVMGNYTHVSTLVFFGRTCFACDIEHNDTFYIFSQNNKLEDCVEQVSISASNPKIARRVQLEISSSQAPVIKFLRLHGRQIKEEVSGLWESRDYKLREDSSLIIENDYVDHGDQYFIAIKSGREFYHYSWSALTSSNELSFKAPNLWILYYLITHELLEFD